MASSASAVARRAAAAAFALAMLVQLVVLYAPSTPDGTPGVPGLDKVTHALVFLLPALFGVLAGIRPLWLGIALIAHAAVSELVQHLALAQRSGDVWDAVADAVGVCLGLAIGVGIVRRARERRAPVD